MGYLDDRRRATMQEVSVSGLGLAIFHDGNCLLCYDKYIDDMKLHESF
ncbi:hypothetical protein HET73_04320 [Wolbachia endosymbiont of Atemnus politus]|nr:hypothetical protein [Wolbachia endosymbiont of Atemnus politus]NSM56661.1 hypothetical protein [Wolbachia endosymbiont of Atemnus politus]